MLFLTLMLSAVVNADSSNESTQESNKTDVDKIDYTPATFTPEFIKSLSDHQIKSHIELLKPKVEYYHGLTDTELDTLSDEAFNKFRFKADLYGTLRIELVDRDTARVREKNKRLVEKNKKLRETIKMISENRKLIGEISKKVIVPE